MKMKRSLMAAAVAVLLAVAALNAQNLGGLPSAIGTAIDNAVAFKVGGTFTPNGSAGFGLQVNPTLKSQQAAESLAGVRINPTLAEYGSGSAPTYFASTYISAPTITAGAATDPTTGAALYLGAAGSGATSNYSEYVATSGTVYIADADALKVGGNIVPQTLDITYTPTTTGTSVVSQAFFTATRAYQVTACSEVHTTAGTDGSAVNLLVEKDTGTTAPGSGTGLLTNNTNAGFNAKGTANTVQTGTLTATTASLQLAAGDRLAVKVSGTATALAGVNITCSIKAI